MEVLFTAELRAFSDRSEALPKAKVKVKVSGLNVEEETISKKRSGGDLKVTVKVKEEGTTTTTTILRRSKRVKQ